MNLATFLDSLEFPVDYRHVGGTLDRMAHAEAVIGMLENQLGNAANADVGPVCVFGSVSRGEATQALSDVDLMFCGYEDHERRSLLKSLSSGNRGLDFHGAETLAGATDAESITTLDLRFPLVYETFLLGAEPVQRRRRLQFLLESRPLSARQEHARVLCRIVEFYRLVPKHKAHQTPDDLITDLKSYFDEMEIDVAASRTRTSDYFAKYLLMRQICRNLTYLSIVQAVRSKGALLKAENVALAFAGMLRWPALARLYYWASPAFLRCATMNALQETYATRLSRTIIDALTRTSMTRVIPDTDASAARLLTDLVLRTAQSYNDTIDFIQTPDMREVLASLPTNFVSWTTDHQTRQVLGQLRRLTECLGALCEIIDGIYILAEDTEVLHRPYRRSRSGLFVAVEALRESLSATLRLVPPQ